MSMKVIKNQLKSKLEGISDIQSVYGFPWFEFDGYPAATVTPSGYESDYENQAENLRTYSFIIRLFLSLNNVSGNTDKAKVENGFNVMEDLIDTVVDEFDKDETLSGISLPSGKTMVSVLPVPTTVTYFDEDKMIVGEVRIQAKISFDTTI